MADQVLDIVIDEKTHEFVLLGRTKFRGNIKIFRISADDINNLESLDRSTATRLDQYTRVTDCFGIFEDPENGVRRVLIATLDPRQEKGKLSMGLEKSTDSEVPTNPYSALQSSCAG